MTIRIATVHDKDQIIKLMDEFNNYYFEENIFPENFNPFWEYKDKMKVFEETATAWLQSSKVYLFVAEEDTQIIGYICGEIKERSVRVLDKEGYINDWFVSKNWRHKGVGMQLYDILLEEFKKNNCNRLGLLTNINNKDTIHFYHSLGFIDDSINMVKELV